MTSDTRRQARTFGRERHYVEGMSPLPRQLSPLTNLIACSLLLLAGQGCKHSSGETQASHGNAAPPSVAPASASTPVPCTSDQLSLSEGGEDAGAGHSALHFVLRNTSDRACVLGGAPAVRVLDGKGQPLAGVTIERREDSDSGPASIPLSPGGSATFTLYFANATGGLPCHAVAMVEATLPSDGAALRLASAFDVCGPRVTLMQLSAASAGQ